MEKETEEKNTVLYYRERSRRKVGGLQKSGCGRMHYEEGNMD